METINPYQLTTEGIQEPPTSFWERMKYVGPGFILSASIVGSGELIATTLVGAKAGFILMWFIIFSCMVKVAVQLEFGKHAICYGESTMEALNSLPGPRLGKANWSIWTWLIMMCAKMMQVGGIVGGVVLVLTYVFPILSVGQWQAMALLLVGASVSLLVYRGYYLLIEKASLIMLGSFTLLTLASLVALQYTDFAITADELASGLIPSIPKDVALLLIAMGAFGITGVGGDEIMAYNYWLIEKGYARYTGPREDNDHWEQRAKGWIRVMYWDAIMAMFAYTFMTVMFYLLGAAVLHRMGIAPEGRELIATLGKMYTQTLGSWARWLFLLGAIAVLYSTLFAALAAWTRMFADAFGRIGLYDFTEPRARGRAIAVAAWVIPAIWALLYMIMEDAALMVIIGGLATVVILLIVVFAALYFRYFRADPRLLPPRWYDAWLWLSSLSIMLVAGMVLYNSVVVTAWQMLRGSTD
ncbi:MAG: hypothetical protein KatS3mg111_1148 [Pirellulaceae bacterium]|nr:MAG: hypothetical protein KatS3mg111_1148 [Pirellulaceae bacterium]